MLTESLGGKSLLADGEKSKANEEKVTMKSDEIQKSELKKSEIKKSEATKEKKGKERQFTYILKIFNIVIGLLLIAFGIYFYYSINEKEIRDFELMGYIMPGYITFSGLIILAIEMHIRIICRNMKFLYNYFGRGLFNIYVGIMPLSLLDTTPDSKQSELEQVAIYILVCLLILIGVLYILSKILCCAKEDDKKKKRKRKSEIDSESSDSD